MGSKVSSRKQVTYRFMERLAVKVPRRQELDALALGLGPWATICKRSEEHEGDGRESEEGHGSNLVGNGSLLRAEARESGRGVVEDLAQGDDGKVQSGEVMVEEELALHQVEGEVVQSPAKNGDANLIVKALEGDAVRVVVAAALPAYNGDTFEHDPYSDGS